MADMDKISSHEELQALIALQRWYEAMGVDDAVGELPRNHFAEKLRPPEPVEEITSPKRAALPPLTMPKPEPRARPQAMSAAGLDPEVALAEANERAQMKMSRS